MTPPNCKNVRRSTNNVIVDENVRRSTNNVIVDGLGMLCDYSEHCRWVCYLRHMTAPNCKNSRRSLNDVVVDRSGECHVVAVDYVDESTTCVTWLHPTAKTSVVHWTMQLLTGLVSVTWFACCVVQQGFGQVVPCQWYMLFKGMHTGHPQVLCR